MSVRGYALHSVFFSISTARELSRCHGNKIIFTRRREKTSPLPMMDASLTPQTDSETAMHLIKFSKVPERSPYRSRFHLCFRLAMNFIVSNSFLKLY